jgi:hypothetical protein
VRALTETTESIREASHWTNGAMSDAGLAFELKE